MAVFWWLTLISPLWLPGWFILQEFWSSYSE